MRELAKNLKDSHTEEKKTSFFFIEKIKFNCESIKDRYFTDIIFKKQNSISGWKIHLSPLLADYYEVLIEVNKICEKSVQILNSLIQLKAIISLLVKEYLQVNSER